MGRRTVLLVVAAVIAALGTSLVFLYVRGVDARATEQYEMVEVLKAVDTIPAGETLRQAQAAGKIELGQVPRADALPGATTSVADITAKVALTNVYPGEQIITAKFGEPGEQTSLSIPNGKLAISINLSDPARVAGFVNPGAEVAIFSSGVPGSGRDGDAEDESGVTRLLLPRVQVIAVGTTTVVSTTTTDESGAQTTEQLPRTLLTLAVNQEEAERIIFASRNGEMAFGLLTDKSKVKAGPGVSATNVFK
jgi:pilus assembly protein CpaB